MSRLVLFALPIIAIVGAAIVFSMSGAMQSGDTMGCQSIDIESLVYHTPTPASNTSGLGANNSSGAFPTAQPRDLVLAAGQSRCIAWATDQVMEPTPDAKVSFDSQPVAIAFSEFYDGYDMRRGLQLSDKLVSLDGEQVVMEGYIAPPLKPALDWFVLTRIQLTICPFCSDDSDWPNDIALVYMPPNETTLPTTHPVRVTGTMEIGSSVDAETGMVSLVRIYVDEMEILN